MNPTDNRNQDGHFERDLEEIRRHYRASEGEKPPEMVDQAVLNMAKRAVEADGQSAASRWSLFSGFSAAPRWIGGVATAAVVVLAVSLFYEQESMIPESPVVPQLERNTSLDSLTEADEPADEKRKSGLAGSQDGDDTQAGSEYAGQYRDGSRARDQSGSLEPDREAEREGFDMRANAQAPAEEQILNERAEYFEDGQVSERVDDTSLGAAATLAPPAATGEALPEYKADELSDMRQESLEKAEPAHREDPEAWIRRLQELLEAGDLETLADELDAFRDQYPDYLLPESLASEHQPR